jgi:hypothetical protein
VSASRLDAQARISVERLTEMNNMVWTILGIIGLVVVVFWIVGRI